MRSTPACMLTLCLAAFVLIAQAQDEPSEDDALAHDLELLQGKWELLHGNEGNGPPTIQSIKEIKGNRETLRRYDIRSGKLTHEHSVDFSLSNSGSVRVFTFYAVDGDPKQGQSFVYKVDTDNFYDVSGLLQGDTYRNYQKSPRVWHWRRVKADAPAKPAAPEPRAEIDPALQEKLELLGAKVTVAPDGYIIDIRRKPGFTDKEIDLIIRCPQVVELTMEKTAITDQGLAKLGPLKQLRRLILNNCAISSAGLEILAGLPLRETVISIGLQGTMIKEDDLKWLKGFSRLERLDVAGTRLSDASLSELQSLPLLVCNVADVPFSAKAVELFQKEHPKVILKK